MLVLDYILLGLAFLASLGCGLMAGLFFVFSIAVMKAFSRLPPAEGIAAMQSINVAIINPIFFAVFFGTAAVCALLIIILFLQPSESGAIYLILGSILYLLGSFLVTVVFNVPYNKKLASVSPTAPDSSELWLNYLEKWTNWNHARTIMSLVAMALLIFGLYCWKP